MEEGREAPDKRRELLPHPSCRLISTRHILVSHLIPTIDDPLLQELRQLSKEERKRQGAAVAEVIKGAQVVASTLTGVLHHSLEVGEIRSRVSKTASPETC